MTPRTLGLGLAIPVACAASAQFFGGSVGAGLRNLHDQDVSPPDQVNPTQPSGNPLPPVRRAGDLPTEGPPAPENGSFWLIKSGLSESDYPHLHVTGGVEFTDRGYHCWADELLGNQDTNVYTLIGHVRVLGLNESIYGDTVQIDFNQRTYVAENTESTLKPGLVGGKVRGNVYVTAKRSNGSEREMFGESSTTTTCSYASPHFEIVAENTDVRPNRRVIFRKVKLKILGHTVLNLPFLSVPLDQRTYNNLPVVGRDSIAGYFIKNRYSFPLNAGAAMSTRLDYFSRLGTGVGAGVNYDARSVRGALSVYSILGPNPELEIIGQHRQSFGWGTFSLDSNYESNNYLISSSSRTLNTRAQLYIPQGRSSDRFSYYRTTSSSTGSHSLQQTITATDTRAWTSNLNTTLDVKVSDNTSSFTGGQPIHRSQVDVNFRAIDDFQKAQARIDYLRSIPIGESQNFFTSSDVTPALTFLSDSRRLFGSSFETKFPFQIQLGYGEYGDPITKGRLTRGDLDLTFQNGRGGPVRSALPNPLQEEPIFGSPSRSTKRWDFAYQGEFKQDAYSDNTAQYVLRTATQLTYTFHNDSRFHIAYNYLRPYGFTPLQIDRRGQSNNFTSDLSYKPIRNLLLGFATGYDFNLVKQHQPTPWQQVGVQAQYTLGRMFQARMLSSYDTTRRTMSSTRFDLTWIPGSTYFSLGAKYDGLRHKWAAANLYMDGLQIGRLRTSVLLNYNGYTNQFDAMHYSFIYDLHCAEAVFQVIDNPTGFNGGRAIYFFIRLKALPFDTPFGTGTRGQPIGTGTGRDF